MKISSNKANFLACDHDYEQAKIVVIGAPFDGTTTFRPGTRFASPQMRIESYGLETYSPYLDKDLEEIAICDAGEIDLPFGNKEKALEEIKKYICKIVQDEKKPLLIGGEHLVSLPAIEGLYEKYPDLYVIHFDAHTDLREDYMGEALSHSTVMRRVWDFLGDNHIFQFGIRSGLREEFQWAQKHTRLQKFNTNGLAEIVKSLQDKPVYFTIDLDILDPSIFPGTGTPEAGGISFKELMEAFALLDGLKIVGADLVELSPHYDPTGVSTAVACKVMRELLLLISE